MAPQDKKWDDAAERDLCMAMIFCNNEAKVRHNWPRIEEVMKNMGYSFTKDAMSQHYSKTIMKDFRARHPSLTTTSAESSPLSTRKPKAAAGKSATSTPTKKRTKKAAAQDAKDQLAEDGDDAEYDSTPCKRVKKEEKATSVKKEEATDATTETAANDNDQAFLDWAAKGPSNKE
ncbi:hypothetical protein GGI43DRAFT_378368 [Trichoderma evansii]